MVFLPSTTEAIYGPLPYGKVFEIMQFSPKSWYYLRILAPKHGRFCIIFHHNEAPRAPSHISKKSPEGELQCIHEDP